MDELIQLNPEERTELDLMTARFAELVASLTGTELYACGFEILFNPFTDILLFVWIYQICQWNVIEWVLELCLVGTALFGHIASFAGLQQGLRMAMEPMGLLRHERNKK